MKQYLLSIYQPDGDIPAPEVLEKISGEVRAVREDMRAAGAWVFSGGLHAPSTATVLDPRSDEMPMTMGPTWRARSTSAVWRSSRQRAWTRRWRGGGRSRGRRRCRS